MARPAKGQLIWRNDGWHGRYYATVDGERIRIRRKLGTANKVVAQGRLDRLIVDTQPGQTAHRDRLLQRAWQANDIWALDFEPLDWPESAGVYAVFTVPGFVKIGRAQNIARRLEDIQSCYPIDVALLAVLSDDPADERELHERFAPDRIRGEWFVLSREIRRTIAEARTQQPQNDNNEEAA